MGFGAFEITYTILQVLIIILFGLRVEYGPTAHPKDESSVGSAGANVLMGTTYAFFQDVHVMIYVGFGFLMVFLKSHSWTSVGLNYFIAAWCAQVCLWWYQQIHILMYEYSDEEKVAYEFANEGRSILSQKVTLTLADFVVADFCSGAVLISFGALLGKCNIFQLFVLGTLEVIFFGINESIGVQLLKASDAGGSMYVHTFGAYFGLAASYFFQPKKAIADERG